MNIGQCLEHSEFPTLLLSGRDTYLTKMLFHLGPCLEYEGKNIKLENHLLPHCFGFVRKMDEQDQKWAKIRKQQEIHFGQRFMKPVRSQGKS